MKRRRLDLVVSFEDQSRPPERGLDVALMRGLDVALMNRFHALGQAEIERVA